MRSASRALAMAASVAVIAGFGCSAFAGAERLTKDRQAWSWSEWWMNKIEQQTLPTPQLLHLNSYPGRPRKSDFRIGGIWAPEEFKILYLYPLCFPASLQYHTNNDWVNTEAFVMPSASGPQKNYSCYEASRMNQPLTQPSYARLRLSPNSRDMPVFSLRVPEEFAGAFSWAKNIQAPAKTHFTALSEHQSEDNPFKLSIPKRLSIYGDDLRLFEFSLPHITDQAFWHQGADVWMTLIFRSSPPELDEMFSTPIPPSR